MSDLRTLTFHLPPTLMLGAAEGIHPSLHRCLVKVGRGGLVTITGPSVGRIQDQATRFLRALPGFKDHPPRTIAATLVTPSRWSYVPGNRDSWTIIINSDVTFAPTGLGADLPAA